jgi:hypothetical protein
MTTWQEYHFLIFYQFCYDENNLIIYANLPKMERNKEMAALLKGGKSRF